MKLIVGSFAVALLAGGIAGVVYGLATFADLMDRAEQEAFSW